MEAPSKRNRHRALLDPKLTELALYAAVVETSSIQYEDKDGHVEVFPPSTLPEAQEERIELALAGRSAEIFEETGRYILCALLDPAAR